MKNIKKFLFIACTIALLISPAISYDGSNLIYSVDSVLNWIETDETIDAASIKRTLIFVDSSDLETELPSVKAIKDFYNSSKPLKGFYEGEGPGGALGEFFNVMVEIEEEKPEDLYAIKGSQLLTIRIMKILINRAIAGAPKEQHSLFTAEKEKWEKLIGVEE